MFLFFILFIQLTKVKSCPLTDNYLSRCHCGILTNGESYIKCEEKSLDQMPIFKRSFPYDELRLSNNNIQNLSRSSFDHIKTIRRINLEENSIAFIDHDVFRLLGNYLEELILTGNNQINSLEFLTRYPLKKLRSLKLDKFDLSEINLEKIFLNMTNLEQISLRSCQIKQFPNLSNIQILDLENNQISNSLSLSTSYIQLNLAHNFLSSITFENNPRLLSLNLSFNQIKTLEKNSLFNKLNYLNLQSNPLECNCHLEWLKQFLLSQTKINASTWTCKPYSLFLLSDFQCPSIMTPRVVRLNISFIKNGLFVQWKIIDDYELVDYLQISISEPFFLSPKIRSNQTEIFLSNNIQSNKQYHICVILLHKYARDKYCREFLTEDVVLSNEKNEQMNFYMMLIGSCIGGLITFILIFTCCYLCFQIHKFNVKKTTTNFPYHSHPRTCPYHHENLSNSTDSSQIDTSLSTTNYKHIYQTIDSQHYSSLKRQTELFDLWNESLRQKR
jgi:Leucine-rich repeat (LRR) protein